MAGVRSPQVTYLVTDVVGSTALWEQATGAAAAMARHDEIVEAAVQQADGVVVRPRGEGDSRFAVFGRTVDALVAAGEVVRRLAAETWPTTRRLAVRVAVHTAPGPRRGEQHYGPAVNLVSRLRAVAHPGQVLVSAAAAAAAGSLPPDLGLRDLGRHRLREGAAPDLIYQLLGEGLDDDFPPLASLDAARHNLPRAVDVFVGREVEQAHLLKAIEASRLVTVTGPGGTGKTRLALQVAAGLRDAYRDGVWLVELATVVQAGMIPEAMARALGVPLGDGRPTAQAVQDFLRSRETLVVLDNCEHLAAADVVAPLLAAVPGLRVLATSRRPLGVTSEQLWPLGPLDYPDPARLPAIEELAGYGAVALLVSRARTVRRAFVLDDDTARPVAEVCARLEGIPLAIELAAARLRHLPVEDLVGQLAERIEVAGDGTGDRRRSLRATLDWSWGLLARRHQVAFRRLGVFAGAFDLEGAEAVVAGGELDADGVVDALVELVDASLVIPDYDRSRYRSLETVRTYAGEKLIDAGEQDAVHDRHLAWYGDVFEQNYAAGTEPSPPELVERLEVELDNVRAALRWSLASSRQDGLRLAGVVPFLLQARGRHAEGISTVESHLHAFPDAPPLWRARAYAGLAFLRAATRDGDARACRHEALSLAEQHGFDEWWVYFTMGGEAPRDEGVARRGRELALQRGLDHSASYACQQLGIVALNRGDLDEAARWFQEGVDLLRTPVVSTGLGRLLSTLAIVSERLGQWDRAKRAWDEVVEIAVTLGDPLAEAAGRQAAGSFAIEDRDFVAADDHFRHALEIGRDVHLVTITSTALVRLSDLCIWRGEWEGARRYAEEAVSESRPQSGTLAACALADVAHAAILQDDPVAARAALHEAIELSRADPEHEARALAILAILAIDDGDADEAGRLLSEGLALFERASKDHLDVAMRATALREAARRREANAVRFLGAAAAARWPGRPPWDPPRRAQLLERLGAALNPDRLEALLDEGAAWPSHEAIKRALDAVV